MSYHIVSIDSPNCSLSCRDGQLTCKTADGERKLPLEDIASIIITSFSAQIHSHLFVEAAKHGVALIVCEAFKPACLVLPANRSTDTLLSRAILNVPPRVRGFLWQRTIDAKCQNQVSLAEHLAPGDQRLPAMRATAEGRKPHKEAVCAKTFWQVFGAALQCECFRREPHAGAATISNRNARREEAHLSREEEQSLTAAGAGTSACPSAQPELLLTHEETRGRLNDLLNYGYAVLLSTVLQKLFGVGLDPTFGISHAPRERSTPLAYDLMEPFRPCVDWRVLQWARRHPDRESWKVGKEFRKWVTGLPLERVEYLDFTLEIQGVVEGVVRGFRRAVLEGQPRYYRPWLAKASVWNSS